MNLIARLEVKFPYYDEALQYVNHKDTPPWVFRTKHCKQWWQLSLRLGCYLVFILVDHRQTHQGSKKSPQIDGIPKSKTPWIYSFYMANIGSIQPTRYISSKFVRESLGSVAKVLGCDIGVSSNSSRGIAFTWERHELPYPPPAMG